MEPFRAPRPSCTRCGAPNPDHLSPTGDMVCRGCAVLPALDAQLEKGRREGTAGSIIALGVGVMLLIGTVAWGFPALGGSGYGRNSTARLVGLGCGLGLVLIIVAVRNLRIYGSKRR